MNQRTSPTLFEPVLWLAALATLFLLAAPAIAEAQGPPSGRPGGPPFGLPPGPPNFHDRPGFPPGPPFIPPGRPFQGGGPPGLQGGGPPGLQAALDSGNAGATTEAETLVWLIAALIETPDALHSTVIAYNEFIAASSVDFLRDPPAEFWALHGALTPLTMGEMDGSKLAYTEFVEAGWDAFQPQVPSEIAALRDLVAYADPATPGSD